MRNAQDKKQNRCMILTLAVTVPAVALVAAALLS